MPKVVNKEEIRKEIILAFERCIERRPIDRVSLRDIAAEAQMSHPKLLNYFETKDQIILAYVRYTRDYMSSHCKKWFADHSRKEYPSNIAYMNAFMQYVAENPDGEMRPNATTQTYVLGHYSVEIGRMVTEEFQEWKALMEQLLISIYGPEVGSKEAEAMMILIAGTFICNYNRALSGEINQDILSCLGNLNR